MSLWVKSLNDECFGCSLIERNLNQYVVLAKITVFCKTYNTDAHGAQRGAQQGAQGEKELRFEENKFR